MCIWWGGAKGHILLVRPCDLWVAPVPDEEGYSEEGFVTFVEYSGPYRAKQSTFKPLLNIYDPSDLKLVEFWLLKVYMSWICVYIYI